MISARKEYAIGQLLKKANDLEIKNKITEAAEQVKKAIEINPGDGNLYNRLGDLFLKTGNKEESVKHFRKGVEAFRRENFPRNALALGKKILRHDPSGFDMYYTIADVLVELDEKQDAAEYMFEYIEKQREHERTKEVLNALEYVKTLELKDEKIEQRIAEYRAAVTGEKAAEVPKAAGAKERPVLKESASTGAPGAGRVQAAPVTQPKAGAAPLSDGSVGLRKDIDQLAGSVKKVESAVGGLQEAVRSNEAALAVEGSLKAMAAEQKKTFASIRESLGDEMNQLERSVRELRQNADKNAQDLQRMLDNLGKALASLSKNQASTAQQLSTSIAGLDSSIKSMTEQTIGMIKSVQDEYKCVTEKMCDHLDDTKDASSKLNVSAKEMKTELGGMGDSLSKFIVALAAKEKRHDLFLKIILGIVALICGLSVVSLFVR